MVQNKLNKKIDAVQKGSGKATGEIINAETGEKKNDFEPEIIAHDRMLGSLLSELKPIDYYEVAKLSQGEVLTKRHYIILTIEEILRVAKINHWSLCIREQVVYIYNGAYWKEVSKQELSHFLGEAALCLGVDMYQAKYYGFHMELVKQFFSAAYLPMPDRIREEVLINLSNGTYVVRPDGQYLKPFERADFITYQLPFELDEKKGCKLFHSYLDKVLPDPVQQMILAEFLAYVFIKHRSLKLEKTLILYGLGANGKSVFFDIVKALLGTVNISNYSLQSLTDEKGYHRAMLKNKLVNYASEISPRMNSTLFKQLVSGEPIEARLPYGDPFILEDYAKLIFNTNELPKDVEHNVAFFRRFVILHFAVTIPENERDSELSEKIIRDELPGVFNWVLQGLQRLLRQKKLTQSEAVDKMISDYRLQSDSIQLFIEEENYKKSHQKETSLKILYMGYQAYCQDSGCKAVSLKVFSERLKNLGFILKRKANGNFVDIENAAV